MSRVLQALRQQAAERPGADCLVGSDLRIGWADTLREVQTLSGVLIGHRVGLLLDNHPGWAVLDLACLAARAPCVPLPGFFSDEQLRHVLDDAGIDLLIGDDPQRMERLWPTAGTATLPVAGRRLNLRSGRRGLLPLLEPGLAKITYTSGTTGEPKGVMLTVQAMESVAASLAAASGAGGTDSTLALTPMALLLQNIGGLYAPLLAGAVCHLPSLAETGLRGGAGFDVQRMLESLHRYRPSSIILLPQMLRALIEALEAGARAPAELRFVAVGGAPLAAALLARAERLGVPVYEGYGLSEAASVVTLNRPGTTRVGSVGRPLPHARVRVAADGEIHVGGALFRGYLGDTGTPPAEWWATGDLGRLDDDGYLYLHGRKRDVFITALGRNVAPEWVENELLAHPALAQALVYGEARPFNVALLVARPGVDTGAVGEAVEQTNRRLPDYARVGRFALLEQPFSTAEGHVTGNGRLRRPAIVAAHRQRIEDIYREAGT